MLIYIYKVYIFLQIHTQIPAHKINYYHKYLFYKKRKNRKKYFTNDVTLISIKNSIPSFHFVNSFLRSVFIQFAFKEILLKNVQQIIDIRIPLNVT